MAFRDCLWVLGLILLIATGDCDRNFFHVSDVHLDLGYVDGDGSQPFGRYGEDPPYSLWSSTLDKMVEVDATPDFIVFTGDMVAHHCDKRLDTIRNVTLSFQKAFPGVPVIATLGNDDLSSDYYLEYGSKVKWLKDVADIWAGWFDEGQKASFCQGGFFSFEVPNSPILLLSFNSMYYSHKHQPDEHDQYPDPQSQFEWLDSQLHYAESNQKKVFFVSHIPFGMDDFSQKTLWHKDYVTKMMNLTLYYENVIFGGMFGHLHQDLFRVVRGSNGPFASILISGAISPIDGNNPTFRYVSYDRSSGDLLDYVSYFADLDRANAKGIVEWQQEYTFSEAYETDLSASGLADLSSSLGSDAALFKLFANRIVGQYDSARYIHLCSQVTFDADAYAECIAAAPRHSPIQGRDR